MHWELPGGIINGRSNTSTIGDILVDKVHAQTGIRITKVLGAAREKPLVMTAIDINGDLGMVHLVVLVEAPLQEIVLADSHCAWRWLDSEAEAFSAAVKRSHVTPGMKIVRLGLQAAKAHVG